MNNAAMFSLVHKSFCCRRELSQKKFLEGGLPSQRVGTFEVLYTVCAHKRLEALRDSTWLYLLIFFFFKNE